MQCTGSFSSLGRCGTAAACCCCPLLPAVPSPHWAIIYNSVTLSVFSANLTQVCPACSEMLVSKIKPRTDALQMQWFILRLWLLLLPAAARNVWNLWFWWISGDPQRYGTCESNGLLGVLRGRVGLATRATLGTIKGAQQMWNSQIRGVATDAERLTMRAKDVELANPRGCNRR